MAKKIEGVDETCGTVTSIPKGYSKAKMLHFDQKSE